MRYHMSSEDSRLVVLGVAGSCIVHEAVAHTYSADYNRNFDQDRNLHTFGLVAISADTVGT